MRRKNKIIIYSGRGGYYWRAIAANSKIVAIGGEGFERRIDAVDAAGKFGPHGWEIYYRGEKLGERKSRKAKSR